MKKLNDMDEMKYYLEESAEELDIFLTGEQIKMFKKYYSQLMEHNKKFNLTTITGEKNIAIKHFIDSLTCAGAVDMLNKEYMADIGTGAGFPGLPLKILYEHLTLYLVDSQKKRIFFLNNIINELSLSNVYTYHKRAEEFGRLEDNREFFDLCTSRAVASLNILVEYCLPVVKTGGFFVAMKGPEVESEIEQSKKSIEILGGKIVEIKNLKLPFLNEKRSLIIIEKCEKTPERYPRKPGIPEKRPLK